LLFSRVESSKRPPDTEAEQQVAAIMRAAASWAREAPPALEPAIRAVCVRLAEMVADQRHYLSPLPEPQQTERTAVLNAIAARLRSNPVTSGIESHLEGLEELELRSTGSWAIVASAQNEWVTTAIQYLEGCATSLPSGERPDPYWADDVVAGIIASVRALIGVDELHARTEAQFLGQPRKEPGDVPDAQA
jgi:hypothetical protein